MRHLFLALLLSLPAALAADWPDLSTPPASSAKEGSKDAALVIGIEAYRDLDPVLGARANAEDWYRWLVKTRGVPLARVHRLVDDEAQDHKIRSELKMAAAEVQPGGTLWVVFIGHGAPTRDLQDGVLIGVDAAGTEDGLYQRSVPRSELLSLINAGRQQQAVVLLDACFTGQSQEGRALVPGLQASGLVPTSARVQSKVTLLTATSEGEFARRLPGTSRPAFSYLALGGLRGWADEDGDGQVTASELAQYATGALRATVRGGTQTPQWTGEDRVLARGKERGPDLVELAVAAPSAPAPVNAARIDLGGGSTDFGALAAQAQAAEAARRQAEAAAAEAAAALAKEERKQLDAAAAKVRTQASADFAKLAGLLATPTESGKPVLEAYVAKYGSAKVTVGSRTEAVDVPEVARVAQALQALGLKSAGVSVAAPAADLEEAVAAIGVVVNRGSKGIESCYTERLKSDATIQGRWRVTFTVGPLEPVSDIKVEAVNNPDPALELCIAREVRTWRFPDIHHQRTVSKIYAFSP